MFKKLNFSHGCQLDVSEVTTKRGPSGKEDLIPYFRGELVPYMIPNNKHVIK